MRRTPRLMRKSQTFSVTTWRGKARVRQASLVRSRRWMELERMASIVRAADVSLWVWHIKTDVLEVDTRWCEIMGCPSNDLVAAAATWESRAHPDAYPIFASTKEKMIAGDVVDFEFRMRHDAGHWIWLTCRGRLVELDVSGLPLRCAGSITDITERKRIELALQLSEESLSTTLQSIGDAVIATDADGSITRINPTAEALTGWSAFQALGRPLGSVFRQLDGSTRLPVIDPVKRVLEKGEVVTRVDDTLLISRDGAEHQISDSAAPIRNPSGATTGVVLVFSDVTEAYRIQRALRDSERQMRMITDATPSAIGRFDAELRFIFANRAYEVLLNTPASRLVGRSFAEFFGATVTANVAPYVERVMRGERLVFEENFDTPNHGRRRAVVTLVPDFDPQGRVRGHFSISTDVTDLRALEDHLRESQKMDSIGTLAGGIAHDFNNVLAVIIGNVQLAIEQLAPAHPAHVNLAQVRRASLRARGLVQQILTFSRREPEQLVTMPLQPLFEETLDILRPTLPARVGLLTEIATGVLYANADTNQIQQVLVNLCTNAWHALEGGPGCITLGLERVSLRAIDLLALKAPELSPGDHAHLWVSDDGVGMDLPTQQRMFEPFFTTKPVGQGTGLGLSVVHGIVRTHLGAIRVDSTVGVGTTLHVYLPVIEPSSQVGDLKDAGSATSLGQGQRVMVVDDDEAMIVMVEQILIGAGYFVTPCPDATTALSTFAENPQAFDLVVTDFNMPDLSGLALAERLAVIRPEMPIVISSGYLSEELRAGARSAGVRHLFRKQNTVEELASIVELALRPATRKGV